MSANLVPESPPERPTRRFTGAAISILRRIPTQHVLNLAGLMLLPLLLAHPLRVAGGFLRDPDVWWHVANARNLLSALHFVRHESFSFTVAGQPWINPEWLSEIPYWLGFKSLHFAGIFLVTWLALSANLVLLYWRCLKKTGRPAISFWATAFVFTLMIVNSGPRTIIVAYLALQAELLILEAFENGNRRILWFLPPLFCVWINLHGSWLIGLGLFALYFVCGLFSIRQGVFNQLARRFEDNRALLLAFSGSVLALFANPYGWGLVYNPFDMMFRQNLNIAMVEEWRPLSLATTVGKCALLAIVFMLVANMIRRRDWKVYELAFIVFAWFAAFEHMRFTFLAALLVAPFLALDLARIFSGEKASAGMWVDVRNLALIAVVVWAMARSMPTDAQLDQQYRSILPVHLTGAIQPGWRTLNGVELGGLMDLQGKPNFIDTRFDTFEHHGVFADFLEIVNLNAPLENLDKYRIDHVLMRERTPLVYLLRRVGWIELAREGEGANSYVLLARAQPQTAQPNSLQPTRPPAR